MENNTETAREPLYLLDGSAFIYRAYHALPPFKTKDGFPTQAIYGFTSMILKILHEKRPKFLSIAFDSKGPTFRRKILDIYKTNRPPMPENLSPQIPVIKEILTYFEISYIEKENYEADDILATLSRKGEKMFPFIYILTSDKDMLQLIDNKVKVIEPFGKEKIYDRDKVEEKFGIPPEKILDYLSLTGDFSDNIPGVPGIGRKTAKNLLREFGNIKKIFLNCDKIRKPIKEKLIQNREIIERNQDLIKLINLPIDVKIEFFKIGEPDIEKLERIFMRLEFKKLVRNLQKLSSLF